LKRPGGSTQRGVGEDSPHAVLDVRPGTVKVTEIDDIAGSAGACQRDLVGDECFGVRLGNSRLVIVLYDRCSGGAQAAILTTTRAATTRALTLTIQG
jgi:hypothetical protein